MLIFAHAFQRSCKASYLFVWCDRETACFNPNSPSAVGCGSRLPLSLSACVFNTLLYPLTALVIFLFISLISISRLEKSSRAGAEALLIYSLESFSHLSVSESIKIKRRGKVSFIPIRLISLVSKKEERSMS